MVHSRQKVAKVFCFLFSAASFLVLSSFSTIRSIIDFPQFQSTIDVESRSRSSTINPAHSLRSNVPSTFLFSKDDIDFKPTIRITERRCDPNPSQPPKKISSFQSYEYIKSLTELTTIHGDSETPLAICKFSEPKQGRYHFPHAMQHLYMCYTFWQDNPSRVPVLYIQGRSGKEKMIQIFSENPFLKGFIELLTSELKVEILTYGEIIDWLKANTTKIDVFRSSNENNTSMITTGTSLSSKHKNDSHHFGFQDKEDESYNGDNDINFKFREMQRPIGYVLSHVNILNQMAKQHFDFGEGERNRNSIDYHHDSTQCSTPRIGILNRKPSNGRSISNAEYLVQNVTSELLTGSDIMMSSSSPLSLTYFEQQTFKQQVQFFHNIDLLISPHGAQLTGIPFLANKPCTKMIELFPHNYLLPDYFGTLARDSGIEYSYIYFSKSPANVTKQAENRSELEGRIVPLTLHERGAARKQSICINPAMIVDTLRDAIRSWCECKKLRKNKS